MPSLTFASNSTELINSIRGYLSINILLNALGREPFSPLSPRKTYPCDISCEIKKIRPPGPIVGTQGDSELKGPATFQPILQSHITKPPTGLINFYELFCIGLSAFE